MGITYAAKIVVGLPYEDLDIEDHLDDDQTSYDFFEENDLEWVQPYYDADINECLIGTTIVSARAYSWTELPEELKNGIDTEKKKFYNIFGVEAKVYLSLHSS